MELRQLEYFVAIVETGSFSKAARRCNVAQPSLSQQIIKLEKTLGQQLFDRMGRSIALTEAGHVLYPQAKAILSGVQQAKFSITEGFSVESGRLSIGILPTLAPYLLRDTVIKFQARFPDVELTVREDTTDRLMDTLLLAEIDVCYVSLPIKNKQIASETLFVEPLLVAISRQNPLAQNGAIRIEKLEASPFIMLHDEHCLSDQTDAFCYAQQINPQVLYKTSQIGTALEFVRLNIGVSLVPACAAAMYPHDDLAFLPILNNPPERAIVAARYEGRAESLLEQTFTAYLTEVWHHLVGEAG